MLNSEHLAGAGKTALHLIGDQQNAMFVADRAQRRQQFRRRRDETAFTLHRLDDDGRHLGRIDIGLEEKFQCLQRIRNRDLAIRVWKRQMINSRHRDAERLFVGLHLAGQGHRHRGAAMKTACEGDDADPAGRRPGDFDSVFNRFRTGGQQDRFGLPAEGGDGV